MSWHREASRAGCGAGLRTDGGAAAAGCRIGEMAGCGGGDEKEVGGTGSKTGAAPGGPKAEAIGEHHGRW